MDYQFAIVVEPNTSKSDLKSIEVTLPCGVISRIRVYFPWGSAGLLGVAIFHNERQIYPSTVGEYYQGNDILIEFEDSYKLEENWNRIVLKAYNEDDTYVHTAIVGITLIESDRFLTIPELLVGIE